MRHLLSTRTVIAFSALIALVSAGLPVAPAAAAHLGARHALATGMLLQDVEEDAATGCPTGVGLTITPGEHCVPWPVSMVLQEGGSGSSCGSALFMQEPLNANIDEYLALWSWTKPDQNPPPARPWLFTGPGSGPYAEEAWSTTALTPENTGVDVHYPVPDGFGAWFVRAGGD